MESWNSSSTTRCRTVILARGSPKSLVPGSICFTDVSEPKNHFWSKWIPWDQVGRGRSINPPLVKSQNPRCQGGFMLRIGVYFENDHYSKSILLMIPTSPFSSLSKSHLFQHLPNFKNHRFLEVLIFHIPLNSFPSPLDFVTPISRLPTHCRRVFMVRRQRSPLPLQARPSKKITF